MPLEEAADIDELERQLYARIQIATNWIEFIQSTMDLIEQLMQAIESASLFAKRESHTMADLIVALRNGKDEIQQTSQLAEDVKASLVEIRARSDVDETAKRITTLSSKIDTSLTKAGRHADGFQEAIGEVRDDFVTFASRIRRQTAVAAMLLTVILVWIAVAQLSLATHGWKALRLRPPGGEDVPVTD